MRIKLGDHFLFADMAWVVHTKHSDGTLQIKCLTPQRTWIDNMQVRPDQLAHKITKEVADIMRAV